MFATQILHDTYDEDRVNEESSSEVVGYIVVDDKQHAVKKGENKIGRDPTACSVVLENHTVSKVHAVIESEGRDDTFIYDIGSTNHTKLGKKNLKAYCRYKLEDGSVITLGNLVVKYVFPTDKANSPQLSEVPTPPLSGNASYPDYLNLGDIFDVPTQANVPQPTTSKEIKKFEELPENFQVFKLPKLLCSGTLKNSYSEISQGCFDKMTQCQLSLNPSPKPLENHFGSLEDFNIFNLSTQYQISQPSSLVSISEKEHAKIIQEEDNKVNDGDKIESLLNDGQDDIFCTFMSFHTVDKQQVSALCKGIEIKTEPLEIPSLDETFDEPTKEAPQLLEESSAFEKEMEKLKEDLKLNKSFGEDFYYNNQIDSGQKTDTVEEIFISVSDQSTTNGRKKGAESKNSQENLGENSSQIRNDVGNENLLKTQENFVCKEFESTLLQTQIDNLSLDVVDNAGEISDAESYLEVTLEDISYQETCHKNLTDLQKLTPFEKVTCDDLPFIKTKNENCKRKKVSEEFKEDLAKAKVFNSSKNVKNSEILLEKNVGGSQKPFVVEESSDEDVESCLEITLDNLTQKSKDDDFINKQPQVKVSEAEKENKIKIESLDRADTSKNYKIEKLIDAGQGDSNRNMEVNEELQSSKEDVESQDFICTQVPDSVMCRNSLKGRESKKTHPHSIQTFTNLKESEIIPSSQESSSHLVPQHSKMFICNEAFNTSDRDKHEAEIIEATEIHSPVFQHNILKKKCQDIRHAESLVSVKVSEPCTLESSGDETESDLEIIESNCKKNKISSSSKSLAEIENVKLNEASDISDHCNHSAGSLLTATDDTNSSYVFQIEPEIEVKHIDVLEKNCELKVKKEEDEEENIVQVKPQNNDIYDSDETDCEEIEAINSNLKLKSVKEEPMSDETQILTLFVGTNDGSVAVQKSPKIERANDYPDESNHSWSQLSLEMPSTQEIETSLQKILKRGDEQTSRDIKVADENEKTYCPTPSKRRKIDMEPENSGAVKDELPTPNKPEVSESTVKRIRDKVNVIEVVPCKKSKTYGRNKNVSDELLKNDQKQFSKLLEVHDVAQIKPRRTRNWSRNHEAGESLAKVTDSSEGKASTSRRNSCSKRGSVKNKKVDTTLDITKKVAEAKRLFQSGRKKEFIPPTPSDGKPAEIAAVTRILRSARRNSGSLIPSHNLFDSPVTSNFEKGTLNNRRNSKTKNLLSDCSSFSSSSANIVFTGFDSESLEKVISELGGTKMNELPSSQVVVTDKVRRTVKFLCAVGLGLPITSPQWLLASHEAKKFLNPWNYILKDEDSESKWDFDLKTSLEQSKKKKLLEGFSVFATENTKPPVKDLLAIVECCGGTPLLCPPETWPKKTIVVSCLEDKSSWPLSKYRYIKIVHYECILSGVLKQKIDFKTYKLR